MTKAKAKTEKKESAKASKPNPVVVENETEASPVREKRIKTIIETKFINTPGKDARVRGIVI